MATGQLIFQPPMFDWQAEDQPFQWKGQVTLALRASSINKDIWFATIVGFLGKEGFRWWSTLPILMDEESQKNPEAVFKAIVDTLEVSTSYWNHIDEMYSDIWQGEQETTDQLDQCIKDIVKCCQYQSEDEKMVCRTELLFHATKHFEVKKWVRSQKKKEDVTYQALLQHAKQHEMMVKDFNWHKSNGRILTAIVINKISSFKYKIGNGNSYKAKGGQGKTCGKCGQLHPPRECPAWGKKCHKCGNKNNFTTCCRTRDRKDSQDRDQHRLTCRASWNRRESRLRHRRYMSEDSEDRSRSRSMTQSAHSIELNSFQNPCNLHGRLPSNVHERLSRPWWKH